MNLFNMYEQVNKVNSLAILLESVPITRKVLKSLGVKKGSVTEKAILVGGIIIIGKFLFSTK